MQIIESSLGLKFKANNFDSGSVFGFTASVYHDDAFPSTAYADKGSAGGSVLPISLSIRQTTATDGVRDFYEAGRVVFFALVEAKRLFIEIAK